MQKWFKLRAFLAAVALVIGGTANTVVAKWVVPNYSPSMMFADDPTNTFGVGFLQQAGPLILTVAILIAIVLFVPEMKAAFKKTTEV